MVVCSSRSSFAELLGGKSPETSMDYMYILAWYQHEDQHSQFLSASDQLLLDWTCLHLEQWLRDQPRVQTLGLRRRTMERTKQITILSKQSCQSTRKDLPSKRLDFKLSTNPLTHMKVNTAMIRSINGRPKMSRKFFAR